MKEEQGREPTAEEKVAEMKLAAELLPLFIDCLNGIKLFSDTIIPFDPKATIYRAVELQKALAILVEKALREGMKKDAQ